MVRRKLEPEGLNLNSMIDILSIMLFFLMTTVSFLTLKTLNASVPKVSSGAVSTGNGVDVSVEILKEGYRLKASGQPEDPSQKPLAIDKMIPLRAPDVLHQETEPQLDEKALTAALWDIKKVAPEVKVILIFPKDDTPFQSIIRTMDAAREKRSTLDRNKVVPMFTKPVLSETVGG